MKTDTVEKKAYLIARSLSERARPKGMYYGMPERVYHFGNLKETLIELGIEIIHEEGIEKFSLRKAAKKVGVSVTDWDSCIFS